MMLRSLIILVLNLVLSIVAKPFKKSIEQYFSPSTALPDVHGAFPTLLSTGDIGANSDFREGTTECEYVSQENDAPVPLNPGYHFLFSANHDDNIKSINLKMEILAQPALKCTPSFIIRFDDERTGYHLTGPFHGLIKKSQSFYYGNALFTMKDWNSFSRRHSKVSLFVKLPSYPTSRFRSRECHYALQSMSLKFRKARETHDPFTTENCAAGYPFLIE